MADFSTYTRFYPTKRQLLNTLYLSRHGKFNSVKSRSKTETAPVGFGRELFTTVHLRTFCGKHFTLECETKRPVTQRSAAFWCHLGLTFTLKCFTVWNPSHVDGGPTPQPATLPRRRHFTTLQVSRILVMLAQTFRVTKAALAWMKTCQLCYKINEFDVLRTVNLTTISKL